MNTMHLFAGAGGGILADLILGHTPIAAVEWDPYCCQVLRERKADGWFPGMRVIESDIREFDASEYAGRVGCVSGGFPCQDVSAAGKGAGLDGERSGLWSEFARVIRMVRPRYAFIENSPMLTLRGLDRVLCDLAALGFDAEWATVSAADAGAPHRRERIWILAHDPRHGRRAGRTRGSDSSGARERKQPLPAVADASSGRCGGQNQGQDKQPRRAEAIGASEVVADAARIQPGRAQQRPERERTRASGQSIALADDQIRWNGRARLAGQDGRSELAHGCQSDDTRHANGQRLAQRESKPSYARPEQPTAVGADRRLAQSAMGRMADELADPLDTPSWWMEEPEDTPRVAQGVKDRVHRLKAIGNGQVPQQAALAWRVLFDRFSTA